MGTTFLCVSIFGRLTMGTNVEVSPLLRPLESAEVPAMILRSKTGLLARLRSSRKPRPGGLGWIFFYILLQMHVHMSYHTVNDKSSHQTCVCVCYIAIHGADTNLHKTHQHSISHPQGDDKGCHGLTQRWASRLGAEVFFRSRKRQKLVNLLQNQSIVIVAEGIRVPVLRLQHVRSL